MFAFLSSISVFGWGLILLVLLLLWHVPSFIKGRGALGKGKDLGGTGETRPDNYFTDMNDCGE